MRQVPSSRRERRGELLLLLLIGVSPLVFALLQPMWIRMLGELLAVLLILFPGRALLQRNLQPPSSEGRRGMTERVAQAEEVRAATEAEDESAFAGEQAADKQTLGSETRGGAEGEEQTQDQQQVRMVHALGELLQNKAQLFPVLINQLRAVIEETDRAAMGLTQGFMGINKKAKRQAQEVADIFGALAPEASAGSDGAGAAEETAQREGELVQLRSLLNGLTESIREISGHIKEQQKATSTIMESTSSVYGIVKKSSDISENSRVLSINAAIEASRAGEHGRGFAVVAGEFKKLTEDSQRATDEIAQIVGEVSDSAAAMVQRSEEGVRQSEQAVGQAEHEIREALGRIDGLMQSTRERIEELGSHAESLARDIREIVVSIQFQDITRQRIEHVIDPLQELSEEFSSLGDTVLSFEHLEDLLSQSAQSYAERLEDRYTMEAEKEVMRQTMEQSAAREGTE